MLFSAITVFAPAKVNLYLEILGRRANGYHDLQSIFMPVALYDRVTVEGTTGAIETVMQHGADAVNGCAVSSGENLATRAARALKERTGFAGGARITIEKHIPFAAGLGGGSSNAAATLLVLNRCWETGLSVEALMEIGFTIGCDVPAFVRGGAVCMEGLGERIVPLVIAPEKLREWWLVLVNPRFSVSTADIYSRYKSGLTPPADAYKTIQFALQRGDLDIVARHLFNALAPAAFGKFPLLGMLQESLIRAGALGALLSGSGGSLFGLARDAAHAGEVEGRIRQEYGGAVWTCAARFLTGLPDGVTVAHGPLEARV